MTKSRKTVATWEKCANSMHTLIHPPAGLKVRGVLRGLAFAKMEGVTMISAHFGGELAVFEPLIQVLIESRDLVEFMGLYSRAFESERSDPRLPALCLRRARWIWSEDAEYFDRADDKAAYMTTRQHLDSRVIFRAHDPNMTRLIERAYALFRAGVSLERADRQDFPWADLSVRVREEGHSWSVNYTPNANYNSALEAWASDWHAYFAELDPGQGIVPDKHCTVSYELSLADRLRAIAS